MFYLMRVDREGRNCVEGLSTGGWTKWFFDEDKNHKNLRKNRFTQNPRWFFHGRGPQNQLSWIVSFISDLGSDREIENTKLLASNSVQGIAESWDDVPLVQ